MAVDQSLGHSQNHLAVAGGCAAFRLERVYDVPTRYREVVLTVSNNGYLFIGTMVPVPTPCVLDLPYFIFTTFALPKR